METAVKKMYEAMFLVDSAQAASDWDGINKVITTILERAGAEIVSMRKWDERKLTYEIRGHSRGTYILCYFRVDGTKLRDIERDVQLSERLMRVLILSTEIMSQGDIEKDTPVTQAEKQSQKAATEPEEPSITTEAKKSSAALSSAGEESSEAALIETEQLEPSSQAEPEKTDESESAPAGTGPVEKEDDAETSL